MVWLEFEGEGGQIWIINFYNLSASSSKTSYMYKPTLPIKFNSYYN